MFVGSWQKVSDLGSGAFGVVSLWKNNTNEEYTAIKMCKFKTSGSLTERQKERWNNEVEMMRIINHPNIIKYKNIPEDLEKFLLSNNPTKLPLLPMEYCKKGNLRHVLIRPQNLSGLEESDVRCILEDISNGLQHLHNLNITHRDLKPDNIVLQECNSRNTGVIYKIIDLGYAKELGDSVVSFVGTMHYLAPEIFEAKNYNNSVDYWSMGILTFEIICGILPFLPNHTPFERFQKIKQKGPEDICIYMNYSGQIMYSSEIKKENVISSCLKHDVEIWLRHVLTYDPEIRSKSFSNSINTLSFLNQILNKKIINVFSMCKLEVYSYEVNEGTQIGTLKDWISRDIKVPKTELLLLISKEKFHASDSDLLFNVLKDTNVYVTRKYFLPEKLTYNFPKLIREVTKSALKFRKELLKPLKSQLVYFLSIEKKIASNFQIGFGLYLNYLNYMLNKVKNLKIITISKVNQMVSKIDCYNKMEIRNTCDIDIKNNPEYKLCLYHTQRLLTSFERSINNFALLEKKIKCVSNRLKVLSSITETIQNIVGKYNFEDEYKSCLMLIEKSSFNKTSDVDELIKDISKLISKTIRIKETTFNDEKLKAFSSAIGDIMSHSIDLTHWIQEYNNHNEELLKSFEQVKATHFNILLKTASKLKSDSESNSDQSSISESLTQELAILPATFLIQQNRDLRYQFEDIWSFKNSDDMNIIKPQ